MIVNIKNKITPISSKLFRKYSLAYTSDSVRSWTQHFGSTRNTCNSFGNTIIICMHVYNKQNYDNNYLIS